MSGTSTNVVQPERFEDGEPLRIAGLQEWYAFDRTGEIPGQWQRFLPIADGIPGRVGPEDYGVCSHADMSGFQYTCGTAVAGEGTLPSGMTVVEIPAQRYAVFVHRGPIATFPETVRVIWSQWVPTSGYRVPKTPNFELYGKQFDAQMGRAEIWLPVVSDDRGKIR